MRDRINQTYDSPCYGSTPGRRRRRLWGGLFYWKPIHRTVYIQREGQ